MVKRKMDCVIKKSLQINKKSKRVDDAEKYSTDPNSYMLTDTELYSNKNIKLILSHYMQDKVIGVGIFDYDVNKEKKKQWLKQQKILTKKLKFDLCKFKSSQLTEKFYILAQQDHNAVITAASIIRFFTQDGGQQAIIIIGLIDYLRAVELFVQLNEDSMSNDIDINILSRRETLTTNEEIDIGKLIEVIKLKINNIDNTVSIDEDIKKVIEVPSSSYKMAHRAIVDKYEIEFQDNEGKGHDSSEEHEILNKYKIEFQDNEGKGHDSSKEHEITIDQVGDTIEPEEIVCEVVERLITTTAKKREKNLSWGISARDNEGKTRNTKRRKFCYDQSIEIFAKAVHVWDLKLFKEAKDKSRDFAKLVDNFEKEIEERFHVHFLNNIYYQFFETDEFELEYKEYIQEISEGYAFLISNVPSFWDNLKKRQLCFIKRFAAPPYDKMSKDLIAIIEGKINQVKA